MSGSRFLVRVADRLDALSTGVGHVVAYFTLATVLICFATVYLRYAMGVGYIWLQESYIWTHVVVIMFGSAYALLQNAFVRVDPFYNRMTPRGKAWVDLFGTIAFLGPFVLMMGTSGGQFFVSSWRMGERSAYESGLPGVYLLKGTMLVFVVLVGLQGIAIACRSVLTLLGYVHTAKTELAPEAF